MNTTKKMSICQRAKKMEYLYIISCINLESYKDRFSFDVSTFEKINSIQDFERYEKHHRKELQSIFTEIVNIFTHQKIENNKHPYLMYFNEFEKWLQGIPDVLRVEFADQNILWVGRDYFKLDLNNKKKCTLFSLGWFKRCTKLFFEMCEILDVEYLNIINRATNKNLNLN